MTKKLRKLLETVVTGNHDLFQQTIDAAKKILAGGYEGHKEDVEALEGIETGFELERLLSQGKWYWQLHDGYEGHEETVNLCPDCKVYCVKRFIDGQCE